MLVALFSEADRVRDTHSNWSVLTPGVLPGLKVYWLAPRSARSARLKAWPAVSQSTFLRLGVLYTLGTFFFLPPLRMESALP